MLPIGLSSNLSNTPTRIHNLQNGISYKYINNILLSDNDACIKHQMPPYIKKKVETVPDLNYNGYSEFKNSIMSPIFSDDSIDTRMALKTLYGGKQIHRMFDAKNSLIKKDYAKLFETELNDNENRIWWEEQKDYVDNGYHYLKKQQVDKYRNIY